MSSPRKLCFKSEVRNKIFEGLKKAAEAVITTLGPRGKTVIINKGFIYPITTKDGVSVAKEIFLEDPFENLGSSFIREVADKMNKVVGDGTTTTTALTYALVKEGFQLLPTEVDPMDIKRGLDKSLNVILQFLETKKKKISSYDDIKRIAKISSNNDEEIGELITEVFENLGEDGVITMTTNKSKETYVEYVEGFQIPKGYLSSYFVNTSKGIVELNDCLVMMLTFDIDKNTQFIEAVKKIPPNKSLLIMAPYISPDTVTALAILNNNRKNICAIHTPNFSDDMHREGVLKDIAIFTGATLIEKEIGDYTLDKFNLSWLGFVDKVQVNESQTILYDEENRNKEAVKNRVEELKYLLKEAESNLLKEKYKERIAKLQGSIAIIKVGGATETELKEKIHRIEDALSAVRAAIRNGILPGGGVALLRTAHVLDDLLKNKNIPSLNIVKSILKKALEFPFRKILENAGESSDIISFKILKNKNFFYGMDVLTSKYGDMVDLGIIDPAEVVENSLSLAISIAGLVLTTDCAIVDTSPIDIKEIDPIGKSNYL